MHNVRGVIKGRRQRSGQPRWRLDVGRAAELGWNPVYARAVLNAWKRRDAYCRAVLTFSARIGLDGSETGEMVDDVARAKAGEMIAQREARRQRRPRYAKPRYRQWISPPSLCARTDPSVLFVGLEDGEPLLEILRVGSSENGHLSCVRADGRATRDRRLRKVSAMGRLRPSRIRRRWLCASSSTSLR